MREITIAIDAMGGDHGPHVTVKAALQALRAEPDINIVLVGLEDVIRAELKANRAETGTHLRIHHASEVVKMDDPLPVALRIKKDSSMRVTADLVKRGEADAGVSAGNTGALMAVSHHGGRPGRGRRTQGAPQRGLAQHRRGRHQGQRGR